VGETNAIARRKVFVLSTTNQIRGRAFGHKDCIYVVTDNVEMYQVLLPAMIGCGVYYQSPNPKLRRKKLGPKDEADYCTCNPTPDRPCLCWHDEK
jgi:hypothetical protein